MAIAKTGAGEAAPTYWVAPRLSRRARFWIGGLALALGILLPFLFLPWILGAVLIVAGAVFLAPRGISNSPPEGPAEGEWKAVTEEELDRIQAHARRCKTWERSALDVNTTLGVVLLLAICAGALLAGLIAGRGTLFSGPGFLFGTAAGYLGSVVFLDILLLVLPLWFLGLKKRFVPAGLLIKIEAVENILDRLEAYPPADWRRKILIEFLPRRKGEIPGDIRLMLTPGEGPEDFIGIQIQVSLNDVQGTKYPYLYAVVLAREGFGLLDTETPEIPKVIFERETSDDVDVIVVRQPTTKTSGYHTKRQDQVRVFEAALATAENALLTGRAA